VEKMLHEVQVSSAPRDVRVSMRTAVWMAGAGSAGELRKRHCRGIQHCKGKRTHVQATGDAGTLEGLVLGVLLAGSHETGHLVLGELDLAATEGRERDVGDLELVGGGRHFGGWIKVGRMKR
jgi:hypothetical protein